MSRRYQSGFGNEFATEAMPGVLPAGQNSPQTGCSKGGFMPHSTPDVQEHARGAAVTSVRQQARWRYGTSDEMATNSGPRSCWRHRWCSSDSASPRPRPSSARWPRCIVRSRREVSACCGASRGGPCSCCCRGSCSGFAPPHRRGMALSASGTSCILGPPSWRSRRSRAR